MPKNHFATLGVKIGATEDDIKKAYRSLAKQWHPDKNKNPGAEEKFKEIGASYEYLQNKDRRELLARELTTKKESEFTTATHPATSKAGDAAGSSSPRKPSYNWNYKGTEKATSSTARGPSPQAGTSQSTPDAGSKKKKSPHWSESFHKKPKGKEERDWKPWGSAWEDLDSPPNTPHSSFIPPSAGPQFSDAFKRFKIFVDTVNGGLGTNIFFSTGVFIGEDFLGGPGVQSGPKQKPGPKVKRDPQSTARESGYSGGLDEDLLFNVPRPESRHEAKTVRCPVCKQMIAPSKAGWHAKYCGKFDAPNDTDDETSFYMGHTQNTSDADEDYNDQQHGRKFSQDWRTAHEDVLNKIRQDRKAFQEKLNQQKLDSHQCEWCGRSFSLNALQHHIPGCREHIQRFGRTLNPMFSGGTHDNFFSNAKNPTAFKASTANRARQAPSNGPPKPTTSSDHSSSFPHNPGSTWARSQGGYASKPSVPQTGKRSRADTDKAPQSGQTGSDNGRAPNTTPGTEKSTSPSAGAHNTSNNNSSRRGRVSSQNFQGTGFNVGAKYNGSKR